MSETNKGTRLSKAAREFNVGISTIVDFLAKKGIDIESKPNTKLSADAYEVLMQEFQMEKTVKEESKKVGINIREHRTISIDDKKTPAVEEEDDDDLDEQLFIKNTGTYEKDLSKPVTEKSKPKETPKKEDPVKEEKAQAEEVAAEKEQEEKKKEAKKLEEEKKEKAAAREKEDKKPLTEKEEKEAKAEETRAEKEVAGESKEKDKEEVKILGKIDLDSMNMKTRPGKKTKEEKKKEAEDKKTKKAKDKEVKKETEKKSEKKEEKKEEIKAEEPVAEVKEDKSQDEVAEEEKPAEKEASAEKKEKVDKNFIPTQFEKLTGPKILDKIDLPEKKKTEKKPVASSKDEKVKPKKKKRRRIQKAEPQEGKGGADQRDNRSQDRKGKRKKRRELKPEVSEEEIQKQIKETLSKLSSTKKSKASKYRRQKRADISEKKHQEEQKKQEETRILKVTEFVTVSELAQMMDVAANEVISTCMQLGLFVSINQRLDAETLSIVAEEFGYEVEFVSVDVQEAIKEQDQDQEVPNDEDRAPIVTVMGHVDHGKTKLLDYVRKANVAEGEAGGITQHIGAYEVEHESGKNIVFLDTPGHEAFTAMRARGAKVTDVAIIVIAADDNVMPQTKEAINHAQAAGVPIVFAINKVDKPNANPDRIKQELSEMNILVEDWGGKYQSQEISAKEGTGINELLEKVLLEAEMLELKGSSKKLARGTVIESSLDKGRGYVAKVLVQNGTMKVGDMVLAGAYYGKVKAMYNEFNKIIKEAGPSTPLLLLGLNGAPQAGDVFNVMRDEREVKEISAKRQQLQREQGLRTQKHITLDEIGRRIAIGDFQELNVIVKGDVDGSVEALSDSILKLSTEEVQVNVIHKSVGAITETDVMLASASNAIIIGFQVRPSPGARKIAETEQIDIRLYSIIYQAIEEIKAAIEGMLAPDIEEKIVCNIEIRETFKITKVGTIAGCMVLDGKVTRNTQVRVIRDGIVIYTGELGSLKRFKDDVKEVSAGYECGLNIKNFNDIKVGDIIEGYEEVEVKRTL